MASDSDHWGDFLVALAQKGQPHSVFQALERLTKETVGTKLFTATTFDLAIGQSRRTYSENEAAYPTGGFKPMSLGLWSETVIDRHEPFSSLTIEEIAVVFPDWPLIQSLGCESNCNIPVVVDGRVIGTINLLHEAGYYTTERVAEAMKLRPFAAVAFLTAEKMAAVELMS
ncbi:GAF domain-containing protein [Kaistia dalseonensis]|uniref:GAF domain-containing protein n=1 Tax=Kaistia dalseonensis TaxID=410840 RepID=A0ABU0HDN7_9HYPH|nr:GAF domain-containing protein [Kaistia dalseonensis]MCX5497792.1 GAF domain-containing protein [Kaistia dalseonensis]MDQ0440436.1 hypothetical protein [Kaistia dalseonensis]